MKASTSLNVKYVDGRSGCYLEVGYRLNGASQLPSRTDHAGMSVLTYIADKSMSILLGRPISLRDEDTTCNFPRELDDE